MKLVEVQVDRLVGPTHHFGGLGVGNVASAQHAGEVSNPASAALQGLDKMRMVASLGVPQMILLPQPRPDWAFLRGLGFSGTDDEVLAAVAKTDASLLSAAMSCSAMWTANAATVSAGIDSGQAMAVMTVANLSSSLHRSIEPPQTLSELRQRFPSCQVHAPVGGGVMMRDEGAANHMRLGSGENAAGLHLFVYGDGDPLPKLFFPRQSRAAWQAIARTHQLPIHHTFFLKQHPRAIDAGAFHNDVVAASHHNLLLHHELAFFDDGILEQVEQRYKQTYGRGLVRRVVQQSDLPIEAAIETYLFNSQIVSPDLGQRLPVMICPMQVAEHDQASRIADGWLREGLFSEVRYVELRQSMNAGGGPACLRLRVPMTEPELSNVSGKSIWTEALDRKLRTIIQEDYPSELTLESLADPEFSVLARRIGQRLWQMSA